MTTLYNRATTFQKRLLRLVEGQIRSACHDHPELAITDKQRRGIAKRIVGELSETWDNLNAARATFSMRADEAAGDIANLPVADGEGVTERGALSGDAVPGTSAASSIQKYRCTLCRSEREAPPGFVQCLVCGAIMLPVLKLPQSPPSPAQRSERDPPAP